MKLLRRAGLGVVVLSCAALLSTVSCADDEHKRGDHEALIRTLRASAAALQASRPDLARGLTADADDEAKEIEGKEEKGDKEDMAEGALVTTLRDSAAALQPSHPELSAQLNAYAQRNANKMSQVTEKSEPEEKGETKEPKRDQ